MEVNYDKVNQWLEMYPRLAVVFCVGTISLKDCREMIGCDRYIMRDIYMDLLEAFAIVGCGGSAFRATKEVKEYAKRYLAEHGMGK